MYTSPNEDDFKFMQVAVDAAKESLASGGIPIGSCLVLDGYIVAKGHNKRVQESNPILHAEMDCLANAGRLTAEDYSKSTLYTTLSPCAMCTGAILLYQIPRVVIADNVNYAGEEKLLISRGVEVVLLNLPEMISLMRDFIEANPVLWNEDVGQINK